MRCFGAQASASATAAIAAPRLPPALPWIRIRSDSGAEPSSRRAAAAR
jgi:hypothetical protein